MADVLRLVQKPPRGTPLNLTHPLARGLVGSWLFNENTGHRVGDSSLNDLDGELTAGDPLLWPTGDAEFGVSTRVEFPTNSVLDAISLGSFSVDYMARQTFTNGNEFFNSTSGIVGRNGGLRLRWSGGRVAFNAGVEGIKFSTSFVAANEWQHVTISVTAGGSVLFFINGVPAGDDETYVGGGNTLGQNPLIGVIRGHYRHLRIWNRALTSSEALSLYRDPYQMYGFAQVITPPPPVYTQGPVHPKPYRGESLTLVHPIARGLVGCWLFNELTGVRAWDSSNNKLTGVGAGTSWDTGDLAFGATASMPVGSQEPLNLTGGLTIEVLCRVDQVAQQYILHKFGPAVFEGYALAILSGDLGLRFYSNGFGWHLFVTPLVVGEWAHVVVIGEIDGSLTLYKDGVQSGVQRAYIPPSDNASVPLTIGNYPTVGNQGWTGSMRHFRIWDRALTAVEVTSLYRNPYQMFKSLEVVRRRTIGFGEFIEGSSPVSLAIEGVSPVSLVIEGSSPVSPILQGLSKVKKING